MKRSNKIQIIINYIIIICLSTTSMLNATILERLDTEALTKRAHLIVTGYVTDIECSWDEELSLILTYVTISKLGAIKGNSNQDYVVILIPGGTIDEKRLVVDGTPEFEKGERVLVFLEPEIKNTLRVVGWHQGKKKIKNDKIMGTDIRLVEYISEIKRIISMNSYKN